MTRLFVRWISVWWFVNCIFQFLVLPDIASGISRGICDILTVSLGVQTRRQCLNNAKCRNEQRDNSCVLKK